MLQITNLHAAAEGKEILKGLDLEIKAGQVHLVMGPNGSGKTTLAHLLAGKPGYELTEGTMIFENKDLTTMSPQERSLAGIFLAFQHPIEIAGLSNAEFLKSIVNEHRKAYDEQPYDTIQFRKILKETADKYGFASELTERGMNEGFSGGEKKRNEMLQMALLNPKLKVLDETDSGLDVDALKSLGELVNALQTEDNATLVITHNPRMLDYLKVDAVHIMADGKIVKSGGKELAAEIEKNGFESYLPSKPLRVLS